MIKTLIGKIKNVLLSKRDKKLLRLLGYAQFMKLRFYRFIQKDYIKIFIWNKGITFRPCENSDISGILASVKEDWIKDLSGVLQKDKNIQFIDLGSNIGLSTVCFLQSFSCSSIIMIEMDLDNLNLSRLNTIDSVMKTTYLNLAVYSKSGELVKYSPNSNSNAYRINNLEAGDKDILVSTIDMNTLMNTYSFEGVVVVKMDIEGAERGIFLDVVLGNDSLQWLLKTDYLYLEYHDFNHADFNLLCRLLSSYGHEIVNSYDLWSYDGWGAILTARIKLS